MFLSIYLKTTKAVASALVFLLAFFFAVYPSVGSAEIIWSGDFSTGDFTQWHSSEGKPPAFPIQFFHMPYYGRPIQYGSQDPVNGVGNGELMELVAKTPRTTNGVSYSQGPTRGSSEYSAKFSVKSLAGGGSEPDDCDTDCSNERRRTGINMQAAHSNFYNAFPDRQTRWFSCSMYLPDDYENNASGWGGPSCGLKPRNEAGGQGNGSAIEVTLDGDTWKLWNRWNNVHPIQDLNTIPWQHQMFFTGNEAGGPYPRSDHWPEGMVNFPDTAKSHAALQSVNKGGWTDWVVQFNADSRPASSGGQGFLKFWKREDNGPWVLVVDISPGTTTRGGLTFNHGIGYDVRATGNNGGYGLKVQVYMKKSQVWNDPHNKVVYFGNIKAGDENATFEDMSPDGSVADVPPRKPLPPVFAAEVQ